MANILDEFFQEDSIDADVDSSTTKIEDELVEQPVAEQEEEESEPLFDKAKTQERFQTLTQHNKELKEKLEEMEAKISEIAESNSQRTDEEEQSQIPEWFVELYGDNESAWQKYNQAESEKEERLIEKAQARIEEKKQQEENEASSGLNWVNSQLELVEETHGKLSDSKRNQLMSIVEEYIPTDEDGNLDFIKGYKIMELLGTKKPDTARKSLVDTDNSSRTINDDGFEGKIVNY